MRHVVVLYLDEGSEGRMRQAQARLAKEGFATPSQAAPELRPHLTLVSLGGVEDEPTLMDIVRRYAYERAPLGLRLESLGVFPSSGVVFLAPAPSSALLKDHEELYDRADRQQLVADRRYAPDSWTPHCTIAAGLPRERLGRAVELVLEEVKLPMISMVGSVGILRVANDPVRIERVRDFEWGR
ncbi:MAG: 2'-5' RNA ligase family protein [Methanomassiliicoccales archaeon]|jgi:2'-5' RNA ligase|nr:2'-5' RNA ligase family protein [Methanomassiliicoccales archaeon]